MIEWNIGAVWALAWLIFFCPIMVIGMTLFWLRRDIQPIKARSPALVLITDLVLFLFVMVLCIQRILANTYPCLLSIWSGFIGFIFLFNTYLWRCWVLYFTFQLTQERLDGVPKAKSKFARRRYYVSGLFGFKLMGSLTVILNLPCGVLTSTNTVIPSLKGDACTRDWGDYVLGLYVIGYACVFLWFAFSLRQVVDGFKIKEEMRFTGFLALFVFIPWVIFTNALEDINNTVFPFSTLFLVLGASTAFISSTLWPLLRSLSPPDLGFEALPDDIGSLQGLLSNKNGIASFKKFLTKEFSVENILFYEEIEEYRKLKSQGREDGDLIGEAQRIYAKYIIVDSPFQVNLPDHIVRDLENRLKDIFQAAGKGGEIFNHDLRPSPVLLRSQTGTGRVSHGRSVSEVPQLPHQQDTPTIFDKAQENIFKLMSTDSFPRYQRSEEYKRFVKEVEERRKNIRILAEEGVIVEGNQSSPRFETKSLEA